MQESEISLLDTKNWQQSKLSNGRTLFYKICNARFLEIHTSFVNEESEEDEGITKITSLNFGEGAILRLGDEFIARLNDSDVKYKIGYIEKLGKNHYCIGTHRRNRSSIYMFPIIGGMKKNFLYDTYFVNAYIGKNDTSNEGFLYLLYRFLPNPSYLQFEEYITKHPLYLSKEELDKRYTVFKLNIPQEHLIDVEMFKVGKYSKFTEVLKKKIKFFHDLKNESKSIQILYKTQQLKTKMEKELEVKLNDSELETIPKLEEEIL